MKLLVIGPQGSGKGTQAQKIAERYHIPHVSTGDIFRESIRNQTGLGKKVKAIIDKGELVPDELTVSIVKDRLQKPDVKKGFLLDGFPRNLEQGKALDDFAELDAVLNIDIPDEEAVRRIGGRRTCQKCAAVYHTLYSPSKKEGVCDKCGGRLLIRDDDKEGAIRKRLAIYHDLTTPLLDYYRKKGILHYIDGKPPIPEVTKSVFEVLQKLK